MNQTHIKHPQHHPHHHPQGTTHLDHHVMLTPSIISIQRIIHGAQLRGLLTQRQGETPVWTSFHLTPWCWPRTLTCGLSALLAETSPLAPYRLQRQAKAKAQEKISLPISDSFQDHLGPTWWIDSFQDHHVHANRIGYFQDHLRHTQWIIDLHGPFWLLSRPSYDISPLNLHGLFWLLSRPFRGEKMWTYIKIKEDRWQRTQWQTHPSSSSRIVECSHRHVFSIFSDF